MPKSGGDKKMKKKSERNHSHLSPPLSENTIAFGRITQNAQRCQLGIIQLLILILPLPKSAIIWFGGIFARLG